MTEREVKVTTAVLSSTTRPQVDHGHRRWWALSVLGLTGFLVILAASVANLAMPAIRMTLNASFGEAEFVIAGYALALAVFLVTGGRLGDRLGHRRVLLAGLLAFTAAALAAGLAPSAEVLIGARLLQGVGAALFYPQLLAIVQDTFEGRERQVALGLFGSVIGVGLVAGQLIGGALLSLDVAGLSWRPAFLILVPFGVAAIAGAAIIVPEGGSREWVGLDYGGLALLGLSLAMLVVPLLDGPDAGWPAWLVVPLVASPLAFVLLVWYERRFASRGGAALIHPLVFDRLPFTTGCLISLVFYATVAGFAVFTTLTLQVGLGFSPLAAALTYLPVGVAFAVTSLAAPRLVLLLGRHVLTLGFFLLGVGFLVAMATVSVAGANLSGWELLPAFVLAGIGQGLGMAPLIGTVLAGVGARQAGAASGVLSTAFQVGHAFGIAFVGLVFFLTVGAQPAGVPQALRYLAAYQTCLPFLALLASLILALVFTLPLGDRPNALLTYVPSRITGLVYSFFFLTGGRVADRMLTDFITQTIEGRAMRVATAPRAMGDFLVHHFQRSPDDLVWYRYLLEEAHAPGLGPIPHQEERHAFVRRQVDEIRSRQSEGLVSTEFDPAALRLMVFALSSYPYLLPQMVRMTTGHAPDSPEFREMWDCFLRQLGVRLSRRSFEPDGMDGRPQAAAMPPR